MEKMNAITFSRTGHVLGVVTRASQKDKAVTGAEIAAGGFKLRGSGTRNFILEIPEEEIMVTLVDYDTRALYRPHLFVLEDGILEQKDYAKIPTVDLDGSFITVTLPDKVSTPIEVWCVITGDLLSEPIIRPVTVPGASGAATKAGAEGLLLRKGEYRVAVFAPGYVLGVFPEALP